MNKTTKQILIGVVISLLTIVLTPMVAKWGNGITGFFSTPEEVKKTNQRITDDSTAFVRALKDSLHLYRTTLQNQRDAILQSIKELKQKNKLR